jgi:4-hydroxy-tetrahydrodipicolinate reductase
MSRSRNGTTGEADAPSGTALALARVVAAARGAGEEATRHGRSGRGLRTREEIAIHALRGGDWVGEHTIFLAGAGETIELRHRAESRTAFVGGALAAAAFAAAAGRGATGWPRCWRRRGAGEGAGMGLRGRPREVERRVS